MLGDLLYTRKICFFLLKRGLETWRPKCSISFILCCLLCFWGGSNKQIRGREVICSLIPKEDAYSLLLQATNTSQHTQQYPTPIFVFRYFLLSFPSSSSFSGFRGVQGGTLSTAPIGYPGPAPTGSPRFQQIPKLPQISPT